MRFLLLFFLGMASASLLEKGFVLYRPAPSRTRGLRSTTKQQPTVFWRRFLRGFMNKLFRQSRSTESASSDSNCMSFSRGPSPWRPADVGSNQKSVDIYD